MIPAIDTPAFALGEAILDLLMAASVEDTATALDYVIRHHAIHAELMGGDDCCMGWLAQVRAAVDAAEEKLGDYINRENGRDDAAALKAAILSEPELERRAA